MLKDFTLTSDKILWRQPYFHCSSTSQASYSDVDFLCVSAELRFAFPLATGNICSVSVTVKSLGCLAETLHLACQY